MSFEQVCVSKRKPVKDFGVTPEHGVSEPFECEMVLEQVPIRRTKVQDLSKIPEDPRPACIKEQIAIERNRKCTKKVDKVERHRQRGEKKSRVNKPSSTTDSEATNSESLACLRRRHRHKVASNAVIKHSSRPSNFPFPVQTTEMRQRKLSTHRPDEQGDCQRKGPDSSVSPSIEPENNKCVKERCDMGAVGDGKIPRKSCNVKDGDKKVRHKVKHEHEERNQSKHRVRSETHQHRAQFEVKSSPAVKMDEIVDSNRNKRRH
jgi:hypothetical protein